jgi:hypothetical protein
MDRVKRGRHARSSQELKQDEHMFKTTTSALAAALTISASVHAQHVGDIILSSDAPQIATAAATAPGVLTPARVFIAQFGDSGFANRTTNPGLNALSGELPPGAVFGVTILKAARLWQNGSFCIIPDERLQVRKTPVTIESPAIDPAPGAALASLDVGISGSDGSLHEHPAWSITTPFDAGVYLLEVRVYANTPTGGLPAPSLPIWIVFNQNAPQAEVDAAAAWAVSNLQNGTANPCCRADFNGQGGVTVQDIFDFLAAWFALAPAADFNQQGGVTVQDIFDFLSAWFQGC